MADLVIQRSTSHFAAFMAGALEYSRSPSNIGISRARQRVGCSRGLGGDLNRTPHLFYLAQELVLIQVRLSDGPVGREPHNASLGVKPRGVPDVKQGAHRSR